MFKKLRNKLLLVNMIIISALLLGCFGVIYFITWQNVQTTTNEELRVILEFDRHYQDERYKRGDNPPGLPAEMTPDNAVPSEESPDYPENDLPIQSEREPSDSETLPEINPPPETSPGKRDRRTDMTAHFVVYTNKEGDVSKVHSPFDIDDDSYKESIDDIIIDKNKMGVISYAGGYWKYMCMELREGYVIGFIDYTAEQRILVNLALILALVLIAALAAASLISLKNANSSIKPVEDSYNRQKQFVADASHELKTPLTIINTNIDVLLSHKDSKIAEEEKWLGYIKSEAERMSKLTNDLLYLTRLDHTEDNQQKERASFSDACENLLLTMEAVIFEKSIGFNYDIEPDIIVNAPDSQLKQLVMILLDNAVKYTPVNGQIDMSLRKIHNNAVLKIRNTGAGINEEDRKQIFERFYRADKSRARESGGYGLGLAIAKAICESCGGNISVESEPGSYTEFTVKI
ncbi:MAG: HAMP domain-containing sensor histidine kinase [bacterium]|nr:HAMP domain-containing sensor histidine kinase [bacterium]